jgi:hypothetical protein
MNDALDSAQKSRREFLEKAGKLAVYTPPAIMLLSYPGKEAIASGGGGKGGGGKGGGGKGGGGKGGGGKGGGQW